MEKIKIFLFKRIETSTMVMLLRTFALLLVLSITLLLVLSISYFSDQNWQENIPLIGALGILISALLASYSVILNIDTTVNLKNREISNQVRNVYFHLCLIKMRLISLENEKFREKITYLDLDRIFDSVEDIYKLLTELKSQDIVSISHNDILSDVHFVYLHINTLYTHLRATRKNLIKPEPSKDNTPIYPNPMIKADFKLDDTIKNLTNILTYLKDGYEKDFKKDSKGIEACADYFYGMTKMQNMENKNDQNN